MIDFLKFLDSEIEKTGQAIDEANIKFNTLQELRRKFLESQRANGSRAPIQSNLAQKAASLDPATFTQDTDNKTHLVLDIILGHQDEGVKAGRVYEDIISRGININRNYVYSILNRQKKRGAIQFKRGKYYPTISIFAQASTGGTSSAA